MGPSSICAGVVDGPGAELGASYMGPGGKLHGVLHGSLQRLCWWCMALEQSWGEGDSSIRL